MPLFNYEKVFIFEKCLFIESKAIFFSQTVLEIVYMIDEKVQ
jgi:hypothetical protein